MQRFCKEATNVNQMLYTDEESLVSNSVSLASDEDIKITPSVNLVKIGKIRKPKVYPKEILQLWKYF